MRLYFTFGVFLIHILLEFVHAKPKTSLVCMCSFARVIFLIPLYPVYHVYFNNISLVCVCVCVCAVCDSTELFSRALLRRSTRAIMDHILL